MGGRTLDFYGNLLNKKIKDGPPVFKKEKKLL
jgi:hypothetical protein